MPSVERIMTASARRRSGIAAIAQKRARAELRAFDGWFSDSLSSEFAGRLGSLADNAALAAAMNADTAATLMLQEMTGTMPVRGPQLLTGSARYGISAAEAYERIPRHFRYAVSKDMPRAMVLASTEDRLNRMMDLEVSLAAREQQRATLSANSREVRGYRRVLRPELSKTGSCGLCVAASDQIYGVEELMPIHEGCNCETMPIVGDDDPGLYINMEDFRQLYGTASPGREVGAPTRQELSRVRVAVDEHGEFGPMLRDTQFHRKNPAEVAEQTNDRQEFERQLERARAERALRDNIVARATNTVDDAEFVRAAMALQKQ